MSEEEGKEFQEFRRSIGYDHNRESTDENLFLETLQFTFEKMIYCRA